MDEWEEGQIPENGELGTKAPDGQGNHNEEAHSQSATLSRGKTNMLAATAQLQVIQNQHFPNIPSSQPPAQLGVHHSQAQLTAPVPNPQQYPALVFHPFVPPGTAPPSTTTNTNAHLKRTLPPASVANAAHANQPAAKKS